MTIVTWDGLWLSSDSRRTTYTRNKTTQKRVRKSQKSNVDKIKLYRSIERAKSAEELHFQGELVLATARAGSVATTKEFTAVLESGRDLVKIFERRHARGKLVGCRGGSLFILTDKSAWLFRFSPKTGITVKEIGSDKFSMGTDARTATFLMKHLSLDAMHAAAGVTLMTRKCGGDIKTIKRSTKRKNFAEPVYNTETKDKEQLASQIAHAVAFSVVGSNDC